LKLLKQGNLEQVKYLLEKGISVNTKTHFNNTLLHLAARHGHFEIVDFLSQKGATPLHFSVIAEKSVGHAKTAELLLQQGGNVNQPISFLNNDTNLIHIALEHRDDEMLRVLLNYQANPNTRNNTGKNSSKS
jgi:ankyrin repeat protein